MSGTASVFDDLAKLIPPPGCFVVLGDAADGATGNTVKPVGLPRKSSGPMLDQTRGKQVFEVYASGMRNAAALVTEAELLSQHGHYARAVAIGITAWEELGKSQIAADYYSGVLSEDEYKIAFKRHDFKTAYLVRTGVVGVDAPVAAIDTVGAALERIRQKALYVSESHDPKLEFTKDHAAFVISRVREHIEYINYAEELNGRIGSKALFK